MTWDRPVEQGSNNSVWYRGLSLEYFLREVMCQAKITLAAVVLWILFSIYFQKNLGTLQADLGNSCFYLFQTVNSHIVDQF